MSAGEKYTRKTLIDLANQFLQTGLVVRTWGNFSLRQNNDCAVITPSGKAYEGLKECDLVRIRLPSGHRLDGEHGKPSSESPMHAAIYQIRPKVNIIAHTHQVYATALSLCSQDIEVTDSEWQMKLRTKLLPITEYAVSASPELHREVIRVLEKHGETNFILMRGHGALILGERPDESFQLAQRLETFAQEYYQKLTQTCDSIRTKIHVSTPAERSLEHALASHEKEIFVVSADSSVKYFLNTVLLPYIDDFAQICGLSASAVRGENHVQFLPEYGVAVCFGTTREDAENVRAVLEKNAQAARIAELTNAPKIPDKLARAMRNNYLENYSKLALD